MNLLRNAFTHIRSLPAPFWVVISATLMNQTGNMAFVFLILYLNQNLAYSLTQASFAFATFSASMFFIGLIGGNLVDKLGAARVMTGSIFANGLILLCMPFIHDFFLLIGMCMLWGLAYGLYRPASQTFVSYLSTAGMHKLTFSVYRLALNLGMSIGPALGGYLAAHSFKAIFYANGLTNLLASSILLVGLSRSTWFSYRPQSLHKAVLSIKWLYHDAALRLFMISMIPICMIFFQHESTMSVYLSRDLHFPLSFYGMLFTINTLIIVFTELPLNILTMHWPYRVNFMLGCFFITLGFAGLAFASTTWHVIALTVLWTIGEMILFPSSSSFIADIAPIEHRGSYMAMYSTCSNLGILFGPWAGAIIMQHLGAINLWLICGLWGMISVILVGFTREPALTHPNVSAEA